MSAKVRYLKLVERTRRGSPSPARAALLRRFVNEATALIEEGLERDGVVKIHEFGTFQLKWVAERQGRNPQTGDPLLIPGQYRVLFRPVKKLEARVNARYAHLQPRYIEPPRPRTQPLPQRPTSIIAEEPSQPAPEPAPRPSQPATPTPTPGMRLDFDDMEEDSVLVGEVEEVLDMATPVTTYSPPPLPARRQRKSRRFGWYASFLAVLLVLLLVLANPFSDEPPAVISPPVAENNLIPQPEPRPATDAHAAGNGQEPAQAPAFPGGSHRVTPGDNLWNLSSFYYVDPFLWPNIYRVNTAVVRNPDVLEPEQTLTLPVLYGPHDRLTLQDRRNLAEGYFQVFRYYKETQKHLAPFALWAAVKFDRAILETHRQMIGDEELAFLDAHEVRNVAAR